MKPRTSNFTRINERLVGAELLLQVALVDAELLHLVLGEHLHHNLSLGRTDLFLESTRTRLAFLAAAQVSSSATC